MDTTENNKKHMGSCVEFMITRSPKKNYEALLKLEKKSAEKFKKEDVGYDLFFAYQEF